MTSERPSADVAAEAEAGGLRVAQVAGIQSETDLSHAALHLLWPFLSRVA